MTRQQAKNRFSAWLAAEKYAIEIPSSEKVGIVSELRRG
jgi:hypothetical protein